MAKTERPLPETAEDAAAPDTTRLKRKVAKHSTATALHSSKLRASMDIECAPLRLKICPVTRWSATVSSITERRKLSRIRVVREKMIKYRETRGSTKKEDVCTRHDVAGMATRSRVTSRSSDSDETSGPRTVQAPPPAQRPHHSTIVLRCICCAMFVLLH